MFYFFLGFNRNLLKKPNVMIWDGNVQLVSPLEFKLIVLKLGVLLWCCYLRDNLEDIVYFKLVIDSRCHWSHGGQVLLKIDVLVKFYFDKNNFFYNVLII